MSQPHAPERETVFLDGNSLTPETLVEISTGTLRVAVSEAAWEGVRRARSMIERILESGQTVYGINTGFGNFARVRIPDHQLVQLQENLIRSHAAGVGTPLSRPRTRMLLALRINVLAKGHSGISEKTLRQIIDAFNADCLSKVPMQGTVGASGDLAPLSHLALGMMGEGEMWDPRTGELAPAGDVLAAHGLKPVHLSAKEGLALINGTQLIASLGCEAVVRAKNIARQADLVAALSLEALRGSVKAFHPAIHQSRPHPGQRRSAYRLRSLLHSPKYPSEIALSHVNCDEVQDSYTMRCTPQVHGITHDTIDFVYGVLTTELNSATDNPMVFMGEDIMSAERSAIESEAIRRAEDAVVRTLGERPEGPHKRAGAKLPSLVPNREAGGDAGQEEEEGEEEEVGDVAHDSSLRHGPRGHRPSFSDGFGGFTLSGGNFHGEYPAKVLDYLAIAVHEISNISERRIERLVNPSLSKLPAFLVKEGGLNSGFMIAHCTAAALVSENKGLCHPASIDSLSTSAAKEDHVSMGGYAARKAVKVMEHVETVVAIELLAACQGLDFLRPLKTTEPLEALHALVRRHVAHWDRDRHMSPDIEASAALLRSSQVWATILPFLPAEESGEEAW